MTANKSKSYLPYLNKLVDQLNNTYHHSINKSPINADYSGLTEKIETNPKELLTLKLMMESELLSIKILLVKVTLRIGQEKFITNSVLKTNPRAYKLKHLSGKK